MTTTLQRPAALAAFASFVDYAGLFPPAALPMTGAVAEYQRERASAAAWMLGRFVVPVSRVAELRAARGADAGAIEASLIADVPADARRWFDALQVRCNEIVQARDDAGLQVTAIEVPLPPPPSARENYAPPIAQLRALLDRLALRDVPVYAEIPSSAQANGLLDGAVTSLSRAGLHAKLRCGGLTADAFPSVDALAATIEALVREGVAFKATAGLHHPFRHVDPASGFVQHGFVNLLVAAALATCVPHDALVRVVAEEDASAFALDDEGVRWRDERVSTGELAQTRERRFHGYGSCSFAEPVEDLTALSWLAPEADAP